MTHQEDLNRIEIRHLREMNQIFKAEIIELKDINQTLQATVELYLQKQQEEYRESKV